MLQTPMVNLYTEDVTRLAGFYEGLGFREIFRTPLDGPPVHLELELDGFTLAVSSVAAAIADHGLDPDLGGRPMELVFWTDDTDGEYARLTAAGAPAIRPPHDFRTRLRVAWVADPDGNPIHLVQRRGPGDGA